MPLHTKIDFVGVSTTQLPYVHDSFPSGGKVGTVRYYTMRSIPRDLDSDKTHSIINEKTPLKHIGKQLADLKLPKIELDVKQPFGRRNYFDPSIHPSGNIYRQKAYYRLKGIPFNNVFSVHRARSIHDEDEEQEQTVNKKSKKKRAKHKRKPSRNSSGRRSNATFPMAAFKFPPNASPEKALSVSGRSPDKALTVTDARSVASDSSDESELHYKSRLREMDRDSPVLGIRTKKVRVGRKLGNIVSSKRLHQLLDHDDNPNIMGGFYFY